MSNYTKATNFASKDALLTGNPLKIVKGTEIDNEFNAISTAVSTKFDTTALAAPGPIGATTPAAISGTTGTFSGAVSGTTGTFSGNVQMASLNGGQLAGLRNKIINGGMTVLQRGTGAVTTNVAGTAFYVADRFFGATLATGAVVTAGNAVNTSLSLSGTQTIYLQTSTIKSVLLTGDYSYIGHYVEGLNVADLKFGTASAKTITISFRARADNIGSTAVISVSLRNSANNRAYCVPVTITNANASYSVTIPGDTSGTWLTDTGIGLKVGFACAGGATFIASTDSAWVASGALCASTQTNFLGTATASLNITDVQLEVGPVATPFEQRPYGMELALCQRYFYAYTCGSSGAGDFGTGYLRSTTSFVTSIKMPVLLRIAPTAISFSGAVGDYTYQAGGTTCVVNGIAAVAYGTDSSSVEFTSATASTVGFGGRVYGSAGARTLYFSGSEL